MNTKAASNVGAESGRQDSWLPMIVIAMGRALLSFNVAALPIPMGGGAPIALSLLVLAAGCSPQAPTATDVVRPVQTMLVSAGGDTNVRSFPGRVEASKKVELAFQVSGLLVSLPVREGQNVAKNDVIAQLRQEEFQARLGALQGQLDRARADLQALLAGARPEERLRLETQVRSAGAQLVNARTEFDRATQLLRSRTISRVEYRPRRNHLSRGPGEPPGSPSDARAGDDCP